MHSSETRPVNQSVHRDVCGYEALKANDIDRAAAIWRFGYNRDIVSAATANLANVITD